MFRRADSHTGLESLQSVLESHGLDVGRDNRVDVQFWKYFAKYGEPDLLVRFENPDSVPFLVLIKVKLNSGKSSVGEYDQLVKYLRLLRDESLLTEPHVSAEHRYLIYLTRSFATEELKGSLLASGSPPAYMFGLEWKDIFEAATLERSSNPLLAEVADFLVRRDMQRFSGMKADWLEMTASGTFYGRKYFHPADVHDMNDLEGSFYDA